MEPFTPMTAFYDAIENDVRIGTTHISLYMALLQQWNISEGKNPFEINRVSIMKDAKINARSTYNKCINDLKEFGYIKYSPSSGKTLPSKVHLNGLIKSDNK